jgi:hypothetical protein
MADLISETITPTERSTDMNHKILNCSFILSPIPICFGGGRGEPQGSFVFCIISLFLSI